MKGYIEYPNSDGKTDIEAKGSPVRISLRAATHDQHERLNRHPLLAALLKPDYRLESYQKLLFIYFHIYQSLEYKVQQFLLTTSCGFDYTERIKHPWLANDLAFFGLDTLAITNIKMDLPEIDTVGQLIGALYTIEGSTLGGQLISRRLAEHHKLTKNTGARFFNGYGEQTVSMWQEFIKFADTIATNDDQLLAAEQAACQTFQLFNHVLDNYSPIELRESSF